MCKKCMITFIIIVTLIFGSFAVSFAAADQGVILVNPVNCTSVTSSNLLVSVKLTQPKNIKVSVYEVKKIVGDNKVALGESDMKAILEGSYADTAYLTYVPLTSENFTSTNKLSFYTKKLENKSPGVYYIKVETMVQSKSVYSSRSYVTIKSKSDSNLLDSSQSGTATFLQNLIKSIFSD